MTLRQLDWESIRAKLRMMQSLLGDLAGLGEFDEARLETDRVQTLAAERILTLVVDLAVSVNSHVSAVRLRQTPADYKESFKLAARAGVITDELARALAPSTSTRNMLVHAYLDIDYAKIAIAIPLAIEQYRDYVRQVATWLRDVAQEPG